MKEFSRSLFIFRRDLRLEDNTALNEALASSDEVMTAFIFDPRQVQDNPYRSDQALQFMLASLSDLRSTMAKRKGRLYILEGLPHDVIGRLAVSHKIKAVFVNRDYTPFSVRRDIAIHDICQKSGLVFHAFDDVLLNPPGAVMKKAGGPYTVFTPFFNTASAIPVAAPKKLAKGKWFAGKVSGELSGGGEGFLKRSNSQILCRGGRKEALSVLKSLAPFKDYHVQRDIPAVQGTTKLSAHLKFGTVSPREAYAAMSGALGASHPLARQLYWRDFFTHIAHHFPHVFGNAFYEEYNSIPWKNETKKFEAWCRGETGFPIVDAGMRELNATGFMHNRVRMIAASFLVKDLHVDWRWGERYFAQRLVDYDPSVNNGNWQWAASTGCDHQPYFRIFNPWLQQKRFDPDCRYIKQWVTELKDHKPEAIHSLGDAKNLLSGYPAPIIDHSDAAAWSKSVFKDISRRDKSY